MIVLDKRNYYKVSEPLRGVKINHLFATAVVEGHINGVVYVDNAENPVCFYVCHPYGMSLLFGDTTNEEFNTWLLGYALNMFKTRNRHEWLQAFPDTWNDLIATRWAKYLVLSDGNGAGEESNKIEVNTRVNFWFNRDIYLEFKRNHSVDIKIVRTDRHLFDRIEGSVIPNRFWENADDFSQRAIAFSVLDGDTVASTAFSAFVVGNQLEIGIETSDWYRGRGYAVAVCSALVDYCLGHDYEPVWACKLENRPSYLLAQKIGFEPTLYWPFYRLND